MNRSPRFSTLPVLATLVLVLPHATLGAQNADDGRAVYQQWCAGCHGEDGDGLGEAAAYMIPRPRDFTRALYQIRTTASGELPTDDDIRRVIELGMPGTTMPGWSKRLSSREITDVIAYVKSFSRFFNGTAPQVVERTRAPRLSEEGLAEGRELFDVELECVKCHGDRGRGDGRSAPTQTDDWDFPIRPADLSENWNFNGGGSVDDIYMRLRTGLDGTPMPSFSDVIDAEIITDEQLWRVAQYVRSLSPDDPPQTRDVIRAARAETGLPDDVDDEAWESVERYYVPMVGQIIRSPRQFAPSVDGLWVQAIHDGTELAMRITWHDPSASPDSAWNDYFQLVAQTMTDVDGGFGDNQGPDRIGVQFPLREEAGVLPYFMGGDTRRPVYSWQWSSDSDRIVAGELRGLGAFAAAEATGDVTHSSTFDAGEWRLQINRPLVPSDSGAATVFAEGVPIPVAFYAADGTNGETDMRGAISSWFAIYLDVPTPPSVFVIPIAVTLLTAAFGVVVVWRAQNGES